MAAIFDACILRIILLSIVLPFPCRVYGNISPDYHWTFDNSEGVTIYSANTATENSGKLLNGSSIVPSSERYGKIAYFNGNYSGIYIDNFTSACFINPSSCATGFSISYWIKSIYHGSEPVISAPGFVVKQLTPLTSPIEVWDGSKSWRTFHTETESPYGLWKHYTITWNKVALNVYVDGVKTDSVDTTNPFRTFVSSTPVPKRLAIGIDSSLTKGKTYLEMYFDDLKIWDECLNDQDVALAYKEGIYDPDLFMLKEGSDSYQLLYVDPKEYIGSSSQIPRQTEHEVPSIEDCFVKCYAVAQCKFIAYKPSLNGNSSCLLIEESVIPYRPETYRGFYFYSMYRN